MSNKIDALTSTRGFASILVVIFHFGNNVFPFYYDWPFFRLGNIAVNYFFVLSGFVLTLVYRDVRLSYGDFIKRRFARIAPVYYLALLLAVLPILYFHYFKHALRLEHNFYFKFILSALFLQAYIPGYALVLNGVAWTISVEFLFYFLFPFLVVLLKKSRVFIVLTIVLFVISQSVEIFLAHNESEIYVQRLGFFFFNPVAHLNEFMIGMTGAYFYFLIKDKDYFKSRLISLGLLAIIVVLIHLLSSNAVILSALLVPIFMLLIIAVAVENPKLLNWTPLVFIGEISYGIYILQRPVHYYVVDQINSKYFHLTGSSLFYIYFLSLLAISSLSYYIIERPLRRKINSMYLFSKNPKPDLG